MVLVKKSLCKYRLLISIVLGMTFNFNVDFKFAFELDLKTLVFVLLGYHMFEQITKGIR
jgi:hypothetical protein